MRERILLIRTGGTIDAGAYDDPRQPPDMVETLKDGDSLILPTLKHLPSGERVDSMNWGAWNENRFVKDSKRFSDADLEYLANIIQQDPVHRVYLITHGTDRMAENAARLKALLGPTEKRVLFVGSMVPLSMQAQHGGDAVRNLTAGLEQMDTLPTGVFVLGYAEEKRLVCFAPEKVQKNRPASREALELVFTKLT